MTPTFGLSRYRARQPAASSGFVVHLVSPEKRTPKRKTQKLAVISWDQANKRRRLEKEFQDLLLECQNGGTSLPNGGTSLPEPTNLENRSGQDAEGLTTPSDGAEDDWVDVQDPNDLQKESSLPTGALRQPEKKRRTTPDQATAALYAKWQALLPTLLKPLVRYTAGTTGAALQPLPKTLEGTCSRGDGHCSRKESAILCLNFDHFLTVNVSFCQCQTLSQTLSQTLVRHGLFPTAPDQIRMAVSIDFLDFYSALFERSCDAINALANALNSFYNKRGYFLVDAKGCRFKEPFRRGLGYAAQWLDGLRVLLEKTVDGILEGADHFILAQNISAQDVSNGTQSAYPQTSSSPAQPPPPLATTLHFPSTLPLPPSTGVRSDCSIPSASPFLAGPQLSPTSLTSLSPDHPNISSTRTVESSAKLPCPSVQPEAREDQPPGIVQQRVECSRMLRKLCPACFGGTRFGQSLEDGGDFQIATDGNFHHRHLVSGGESVVFHDPKHIIPKAFVDQVGDAITSARKSGPKARNPKVPDSAVDECEKSYEAANGEKKKSMGNEGRYDDMGWMSLVCRHDIPLLFGEQQKDAVALIIWFFTLIPPHATTTVLYDIGCILDRSVQMFDILPSHIVPQILFVTTAMHAYGHQWSCQLQYNPRLCRGLGLTRRPGRSAAEQKPAVASTKRRREGGPLAGKSADEDDRTPKRQRDAALGEDGTSADEAGGRDLTPKPRRGATPKGDGSSETAPQALTLHDAASPAASYDPPPQGTSFAPPQPGAPPPMWQGYPQQPWHPPPNSACPQPLHPAPQEGTTHPPPNSAPPPGQSGQSGQQAPPQQWYPQQATTHPSANTLRIRTRTVPFTQLLSRVHLMRPPTLLIQTDTAQPPYYNGYYGHYASNAPPHWVPGGQQNAGTSHDGGLAGRQASPAGEGIGQGLNVI